MAVNKGKIRVTLFNTFKPYQLIWLIVIFFAPVFFVAAILPTYHVDIRRLISLSAEFPLLGTARHPPLSSWLAWSLSLVPFHDTWVAVIFQAALNLVAIWFFWAIGTRFLNSNQQSLLIVALLTSVVMTVWSVPGYSLNEDVTQIPLWAGAAYFLVRVTERQEQSLNWVGLGLFLGLATLTKYYAIMLAAAFLLTSFFHRDLRKSWRRPGPWISLFVGTLVVAPHMHWMYNNYQEMAFFWNKLMPTKASAYPRIGGLALALVSPILLVFPGGAILLPSFFWRGHLERTTEQENILKLVSYLLGFLFLVTALFSISDSSFNGRYQTPIAGFIMLLAVALVPSDNTGRLASLIVKVAVFFWIAIYSLASTVYLFGPGHGIAQENGPDLAKQLFLEWDNRFNCGPGYVLGNQYNAGLIVAYADRSIQRYFFEERKIKLDYPVRQFTNAGTILIGKTAEQIEIMQEDFPRITSVKTTTLPLRRNFKNIPLTYFYSFVPPRNCAEK